MDSVAVPRQSDSGSSSRPGGEPGFPVSAVARRLGIAPATLRTWDRRYGLSPSQRTEGSHRRYTMTDIRLLERVRSLIISGMPPGDAARAARDEDFAMTQEARPEPGKTRWGHGGGNVLPLPGGTDAQRGLARAAVALDAASVDRVVSESLATRGAIDTWTEIVAPVLISVGEKYAATGRGIEAEHILSNAVMAAFSSHGRSQVRPSDRRPVLLACADEEQHSLPLFAVGAALAERSIPVRMLGARVPRASLVTAAERIGPAAVLLWSTMGADPALLVDLAAGPTPASVLVAGPGWPSTLPDTAERVTDLSAAVAAIENAVGP